MRCVFMLASEYGLQCFDVARELDIVEIIGVLTPQQEYELKCAGQSIRKMKNRIYNLLIQKCRGLKAPIYVMDKMNHPDTIQKIQEWKPDLIIVSG